MTHLGWYVTSLRSLKSTVYVNIDIHSLTTQIKETFTPPPPSNWGLPDDGRRYSYGKFPKLESDMFGKTRPPRKWHSDRRQTRRASLVKHQTGQAAFYQTMAPMLRSGTMIRSATKRGSRSLEHALGALANAFDTPPKTSDEKSAPAVSSPSFLDRSLHSYLKTSAFTKQAWLNYPSEKFKPERNSEIISSAEKLIMDARRKQSILIGIFTVFQTRQKRLRGSITMCNSFEASLEALGLAALSKTKRLEISAYDAACVVQAGFRGYLVRRAIGRAISVALRMQALARGRRTRWVFLLFRRTLVRLQASIRGFVVRKLVANLVESRLEAFRKHIFNLWARDFTPLTFRSNFWFAIQYDGLIQLGIAQDEIRRLWHLLRIQPPPLGPDRKASGSQSHPSLTLARRLRVQVRVHMQVLEVSVMIANLSIPGRPRLIRCLIAYSSETI